eukprot:326160-Chlamydomonas_euryale.AAC.8
MLSARDSRMHPTGGGGAFRAWHRGVWPAICSATLHARDSSGLCLAGSSGARRGVGRYRLEHARASEASQPRVQLRGGCVPRLVRRARPHRQARQQRREVQGRGLQVRPDRARSRAKRTAGGVERAAGSAGCAAGVWLQWRRVCSSGGGRAAGRRAPLPLTQPHRRGSSARSCQCRVAVAAAATTEISRSLRQLEQHFAGVCADACAPRGSAQIDTAAGVWASRTPPRATRRGGGGSGLRR